MATYLDGNVRKATTNTVKAMRRSAANRRCPECGRKSALVRDAETRATYCRWSIEKAAHQVAGERQTMMCTYFSAWPER